MNVPGFVFFSLRVELVPPLPKRTSKELNGLSSTSVTMPVAVSETVLVTVHVFTSPKATVPVQPAE